MAYTIISKENARDNHFMTLNSMLTILTVYIAFCFKFYSFVKAGTEMIAFSTHSFLVPASDGEYSTH